MSQDNNPYDGIRIEVLEGWEAVRKRPGMYIGSTGERGLHDMVFEVADRAVDEVLAGRAGRVDITLLPDDGVRVADDGPGEADPEALLTRPHSNAGPRGRHRVTLHRMGVGPFVVNALSSRMTAEVRRGGVRREQEYARGAALTPLTDTGPATDSGTVITFWPDAGIFETTRFSFDSLADRFRELVLLNRDLDISLTDERHPDGVRSVRFRFPDGARELVALFDGGGEGEHAAAAITDTVGFEAEDPRMAGTLEVALRWRDGGGERVRGFANSYPTTGGSHETGLREGVAAALDAYARRRLLPAPAYPGPDAGPDAGPDGAGLTAVVSVKLDDPEFQGSTRSVLGNAAVRGCVAEAVREQLGAWLEEHPEQAAAVVARALPGVPEPRVCEPQGFGRPGGV
ncbi:DNA gyrase subunit B [Kitasatospora sp. NPDC096204]|uniref:DNA gyrase subunit B n=1 Tax=Kitasatospora sp. NPDC096204 TaxID=3364094 RepID=UPI003807EFF2